MDFPQRHALRFIAELPLRIVVHLSPAQEKCDVAIRPLKLHAFVGFRKITSPCEILRLLDRDDKIVIDLSVAGPVTPFATAKSIMSVASAPRLQTTSFVWNTQDL